jgi:hypothetical protein
VPKRMQNLTIIATVGVLVTAGDVSRRARHRDPTAVRNEIICSLMEAHDGHAVHVKAAVSGTPLSKLTLRQFFLHSFPSPTHYAKPNECDAENGERGGFGNCSFNCGEITGNLREVHAVLVENSVGSRTVREKIDLIADICTRD